MNIGEYAESLFTTICIGEGYTVSKPFYHEIRYDLVVDVDNVLQRVQVKSTDHVRPKDNQCQVRVNYDKEEIDWFAIYIYKNKDWYVLPIDVVKDIKQFSIKLNYKSKYDIFKNNFGFLRHGF
tara:strand:+ start:37 stop:405 length:369 start_codon:yes stop_codon:yes gene_type:complete